MLAKRADILLDVAIDKSWFMIVKMVFVFVFVFVVVRARVLVKEDTEEEDARCWCTGRKALVVRKARSSIVNVDNSFVGFISILNFKIYGMDRLKSIRLYYFIMFDLPIIWLVGWLVLLACVCVCVSSRYCFVWNKIPRRTQVIYALAGGWGGCREHFLLTST